MRHYFNVEEVKQTMRNYEKLFQENFHIVYDGILDFYKKDNPNATYLSYSIHYESFTKEIYLSYTIVKDGNLKDVYKNDELIRKDFSSNSYEYQDMNDSFRTAYEFLEILYGFHRGYVFHDKKNRYQLVATNLEYKSMENTPQMQEAKGYFYDLSRYIQRDLLWGKNLDVLFSTVPADGNIYITNTEAHPCYTNYKELKAFLSIYKDRIGGNEIFLSDGTLKEELKGKTLEEYNLRLIDMDNKCLSGINITKNKEANINFDKISKDISSANFRGYSLKDYTLSGFNIIDTDLRNTSATIDLATCNYNLPGKMQSGTLFDEDNKFVRCGTPLSKEELNAFGIKILKKEMM